MGDNGIGKSWQRFGTYKFGIYKCRTNPRYTLVLNIKQIKNALVKIIFSKKMEGQVTKIEISLNKQIMIFFYKAGQPRTVNVSKQGNITLCISQS